MLKLKTIFLMASDGLFAICYMYIDMFALQQRLNLNSNLSYLFSNKLSPLAGFQLKAPAAEADGLPIGHHALMLITF